MTRDSQKFALMKKKKVIAGCCFAAVIFFVTLIKGGVLFQEEPDIMVTDGETKTSQTQEAETEPREEEAGTQGEEALIIVDVAGAVGNPGIIFLPEGGRVYQALEKAGGVTEEGDLRDINLAAELLDGERLYIPSAKEYELQAEAAAAGGNVTRASDRGAGAAGRPASVSGDSGPSAAASASSGGGKININTADSAELQKLKGVGPSTAERILQYRQENGKFRSVEDLKNVKGIGEKTFQKLQGSISVT